MPRIPRGLYIATGIIGSSGETPVTYLLHDEFTTDDAAPMTSPRTCEPGPGTLTLVDTGNKASIVSGILKFAGLTVGGQDPRIYSGALERYPGRAFYFKVNFPAAAEFSGPRVGFRADTTQSPNISVLPGNNLMSLSVISTLRDVTAAAGTEYEMMIVIRGNLYANYGGLDPDNNGGYLFFVKGGTFTNWTLIGVSNSNASEPLYALASVYLGEGDNQKTDSWKILDLGGTFARHFGGATSHAPYPYTVATGDTFTNVADGILWVTWRAKTGQGMDILVRRVDDNNCWIIRLDQGAGTAKIFEKIASVETERASGSQTFTNNAFYKCHIVLNGQSISVNINGTAIVNYASAASNMTATGGKLLGTFDEVYDYQFFPLTPAGDPLTIGTAPKFYHPYGDSKTLGTGDSTPPGANYNGYSPILADSLDTATGYGWYEKPYRTAVGGRTTATAQAAIDAELALITYGTPDYILYNLGANDLPGIQAATILEAAWSTNTLYILDAMRTKWPNVQIYIARVWRRNYATECNTLAGWIATAVTARSTFAHLGIDERVFLEGGDDGATNTSDGIHPNRAGCILTAAAWKTAMGY